jgi:hypothetical protein
LDERKKEASPESVPSSNRTGISSIPPFSAISGITNKKLYIVKDVGSLP